VTLVNFEKALPGRTLVLRGESGAGKTTILNCIAGLARPERGEIRLEGGLLFSSSRRIDLPPKERRIGYAFQHYALFPHLCALDNVALAMPRGERPEARVLLARFGLEPHAHKRPASLSGGERQRLALASRCARGSSSSTSPSPPLTGGPASPRSGNSSRCERTSNAPLSSYRTTARRPSSLATV
jgi:ABC-type sulfate/molybdate transport systems ATPase subunit